MHLDLSNNGRLSIEDSVLIDSIAVKVQKEYNKSTEKLVLNNNLSNLELLLSVISRNPSQTSILSSLCKIHLLDEKLKTGDDIHQITIQDNSMLDVINELLIKFDKKIPIKLKEKNSSGRMFLLCSINIIKSLYLICLNWLWPKLSRTLKAKVNNEIILVDNFIFPNSFDNDNSLLERYFTGYDKYLSESQKMKIWYIPTLIGFKTLGQLLKMANKAKKSSSNIIFQDSWLSLGDYVHSLFLTFKLPKSIKKTNLFMGYKIDKILIKEVRKDLGSPSLMLAICKYKFIVNLKNANIKICHVVDWHENQLIDKALNLAIKKEYPDVVIKGYQGFVSSSYETHKIPHSYELENGSLPDQLFVISKQYKDIILENCPGLDVRLASAFRFSYLYDIKRNNLNNDKIFILIALPMNINDSIEILNLFLSITNINKKIEILVKHHPGYSKAEFSKKVPEFLNDTFNVTSDSMELLLEKISLLVSSASSVTAEAACLGIPVAIYGNRQGVTLNPISNKNNKLNNNIFYSKEQLEIFINNSISKRNYKTSIKKSFFVDNGNSARDLFVCD
jgi:hypothetical protein